MQGVKVSVGENDVFLAPKDILPTDFMCTPDFACKVLCITDEVLPNTLVDYVTLWDEALYMNLKQVVHLSQDSVDRVAHYNALIEDLLEKEQPSKSQKAILMSLLRALRLDSTIRQQRHSQLSEVHQLQHQGDSLYAGLRQPVALWRILPSQDAEIAQRAEG